MLLRPGLLLFLRAYQAGEVHDRPAAEVQTQRILRVTEAAGTAACYATSGMLHPRTGEAVLERKSTVEAAASLRMRHVRARLERPRWVRVVSIAIYPTWAIHA